MNWWNFDSPDDYSIGGRTVGCLTFHYLILSCPFQFQVIPPESWGRFCLALADPRYCNCFEGLPCLSIFCSPNKFGKIPFYLPATREQREPHEESLGSKIKICTTSSAPPLSFPIHYFFLPFEQDKKFFYHTRKVFLSTIFSRSLLQTHWSLMSFYLVVVQRKNVLALDSNWTYGGGNYVT